MYEFCYDYVKPKYEEKANLCYTVSFYVQKHDISKDIVGDVETRFNPSNYELGRPLPKGKNKNNWKN